MRAALGLTLALASSAATAAPTTEQLAWLAGCWAAVGGETGSGEHWMAPAGGSMLGMSRTLRRGAVREFEFLHIRDTPAGPVLVALPSSQKEAQFTAERVDPRGVSFHNPAHDFPQRVIYESPDADTLDARIEGMRQGQLRVIRFPMKRTPCPLGGAR